MHLAFSRLPYREEIALIDKCGEAGRPIVIDGHNAVISGSEPVDARQWKEESPGLYRNASLFAGAEQAIWDSLMQRFFMVWDGTMNRMGRTSKGPKAPFKAPPDLKPGEWTVVEKDRAFYIKIEPDRSLADCRIEIPVRTNGVTMDGSAGHLVIRNLTVTHAWNDGFNLHGATRGILLQNVKAIDCGDDGLSAHDDCEVEADGLVSIGNSTGICHINRCRTKQNRVLIADCHGADLELHGASSHVLSNSVIRCAAARAVVVAGGPGADDRCSLKMDNVVIDGRKARDKTIGLGPRSCFEGQRLTIYGLNISAAGKAAALRDSVVGGTPQPVMNIAAGVDWTAGGNIYDLKSLRFGKKTFDAKSFADYQQAAGQDNDSIWQSIIFENNLKVVAEEHAKSARPGAEFAQLPLCDTDNAQK